MITIIYLKLLGAAIVGQWVQILFKADSLHKTANTGGIKFNFAWFITQDWKPISKVFTGIAIFFLAFGDMANPSHLKNADADFNILTLFTIPTYLVYNTFWIFAAFVFGGFGSYIAFKFQSAATEKVLKDVSESNFSTLDKK